MPTIREVLYQHAKGNSQRQISRSFDLSRDTIRKYLALAKQENFSILASDDELNKIAIKVEEKLYKNEAIQKSSAMATLAKYKEEIGNIYISVRILECNIVEVKIRDKGCGIPDIDKAMECNCSHCARKGFLLNFVRQSVQGFRDFAAIRPSPYFLS